MKRKGHGTIVINGPIAAFDDEEVRTILDAATQDQILVLIPIGHPFAELAPRRWREMGVGKFPQCLSSSVSRIRQGE